MRALVTGHKGFVGRHMVPALVADGWTVHGVDIRGDPGIDVRDFFRESRDHYDLVVHLAAVVGGRAQIEGDPLSIAVDLAIDSDLYRWALRTRPGRVVYFSSSAAYPIALQQMRGSKVLEESDIDLGDTRSPDLTYGWSKLTGEMLAVHARAKGVPVTVLRPFSGYGEDQDLDYPWPSFIQRAARKEDPFQIWGDGTQTRDWVHMDDIVRATLACVAQGIDGPLNIGTGISTSFLQLKELVCEVAGYDPEVKYNETAPTGVHHRVCNPTNLFRVYEPKIRLEDAVRKALNANG